MKPLLLLAAASLLPLAACSGGAKAPRAALDCPAGQGELKRTAQAADGKSCTYTTAGGDEVILRLVPVTGGAYATLDKLEANLLAENEAAAKAAAAADGRAEANAAGKVETGATADTLAEARRVAEEAERDAAGTDGAAKKSGASEGVDIRVNDEKVVVADNGGATRINLPGIRIEADENDDSASIRIGPLHVNANGDEARMQIRRDVRLKGEALSREKRGIRATFIIGERSAGSGSYLGYEAGGPKTGPLTVAVIRGSGKLDQGDEIYNDVKRLVRKNGGV